MPDISSALMKVASFAGLRLTTDLSQPHDAALFYLDATSRTPPADLERLAQRERVLNLALRDISKKHVATVFARVFGYGLSVDPATHHGPAVCKSDENAAHDGQVVECPIPATDVRPGRVYQVLIDNTSEWQGRPCVRDFRVVVIGSRLAACYVKYRPIEKRFSNKNLVAELCEPFELLSEEEASLLVRLCHEIQADYVELDVLRDNASGRIYVVDVNPTPAGPPNGLPDRSALEAVGRMAQAFAELVSRPAAALDSAVTSEDASLQRWTQFGSDPNTREVREARRATLRRAWRPPVPDRIDELCNAARGRNVLDIGCVGHDLDLQGIDRFLHDRLRKVTRHLLGVDILPRQIEELKRRGYNVLCRNIISDPLNAEFDLIIGGELVEHLSEPGALFRACRRMLRKPQPQDPTLQTRDNAITSQGGQGGGEGGRLILTTPNPYADSQVRDAWIGRFNDSVDHVTLFAPSHITELAEREGFVLESYRGVSGKRLAKPKTFLRYLWSLHRHGCLATDRYCRYLIFTFRCMANEPAAHDSGHQSNGTGSTLMSPHSAPALATSLPS